MPPGIDQHWPAVGTLTSPPRERGLFQFQGDRVGRGEGKVAVEWGCVRAGGTRGGLGERTAITATRETVKGAWPQSNGRNPGAAIVACLIPNLQPGHGLDNTRLVPTSIGGVSVQTD